MKKIGRKEEKERTRGPWKWRIESERRGRIALRSRGKTNFRPSYEFSHPSRPPLFRLSVPCYRALPAEHGNVHPVSSPPSIVPDRSARNAGATSRGETDSEIAGGAFEGLRNSIPPQSCSILFVNDRIKGERRFSLLTGPLFIQNRHSYFTSVICKAPHSLPPVGRLTVSVTFLSLLCDSISVRVYLAERVKREIEGEDQGEGGGERSR